VVGASVFKSAERMISWVALALELEAAGSVGTLPVLSFLSATHFSPGVCAARTG
jgi:hypothetical protein